LSGIDINSTLYEELLTTIKQNPDKDALVLKDSRITYNQLGEKVDALAEGLYKLGIRKGDKVGLILPVCLENIYAFFALAKLGAPYVPMSPQLRAYEVKHLLGDSDAVAVITIGQMMGHSYVNMIKEIQPELPDLQNVIVFGEGAKGDSIRLADLMASETEPRTEERVNSTDLVGIMYTSGTTGHPKGAMHTHKQVLTQIEMTIDMFTPEDLSSMQNNFPMFHHGGIVAPFIFLLSGGKLVLSERFDPREALRLIEAERISFMVGAPITAMIMLKLADTEKRDLSSLRVFGMGGSLCPPELIRALKERFNCGVFNSLAITEVGFISTTKPDDPEYVQAHTTGLPVTGVEVKIVDDNRQKVPVGEPGEIACHSPLIMEGYYKRPKETAEVLDEEGWYYTGDIGRLDKDGYLSIFDRKKDMIIRAGENIYPAEIERFLVTHPKIKMAAVIGVPSKVGGERVRAYILPEQGVDLTEVDVINYCRGQIATYKLPDEVRFVEDFPLSSLWKVQKYKLHEEALTNKEKH